jgi:hypothetical protein
VVIVVLLISSSAFGYPKVQALKIAISVIGEFLMVHEMIVYLVVFDKIAFMSCEKLPVVLCAVATNCRRNGMSVLRKFIRTVGGRNKGR